MAGARPPLAPSEPLAAAGVSLRPQRAADLDFLRQLHRQVRAPEFAALGWTEAAVSGLIDSQFELQRAQYAAAYPDADFYVARQGAAPIGRLYVDRGPVTTLIEISLLPERRGHGLGAALIGAVLADARARNAERVVLSVTRDNPARRLYERLGFAQLASASGEAHLDMALRLS